MTSFTPGCTNSPLTYIPDDYYPSGSAQVFEIPCGKDAGKKLFYYDFQTGTTSPDMTVVFVHGNPECSYTFRHIRDVLIATGRPMRLLAMDHIGFGLSDQADFEMVDIHHANNLHQWIRHLDITDATLVVHDWGGPIGIGAFLREHGRVRGLVVLNTTIFPMPVDDFTYATFPYRWLPWSQVPALIPDRLWGGLAAYVVSHGEPQGAIRFVSGVACYLLKHAFGWFNAGSAERVWSDQFRSPANARSSKRNVLQTPYWGYGYQYVDHKHGPQDNRDFYKTMQGSISAQWGAAGRSIPVAGHFGEWDACGKRSVIEQWYSALPRIRDDMHVYPENGHFIEEHQGRAIANSILRVSQP